MLMNCFLRAINAFKTDGGCLKWSCSGSIMFADLNLQLGTNDN